MDAKTKNSRTLTAILIAAVLGGTVGVFVLVSLIYLAPGAAQNNKVDNGDGTAETVSSPMPESAAEVAETPAIENPAQATTEPSAGFQDVSDLSKPSPTPSPTPSPKQTPSPERSPVVKQSPTPRDRTPNNHSTAAPSSGKAPVSVPTVHP